ncbi:uncharacterized protein PHALS_02314 [Plasmopara halstedii]|uniref:Uncharacterized protein n=1 Tax=Plasmopara halstedii TaxID=4781 RepID=A0A0P1AXF8_PLAHL|nr:uncharacterized protein PHALS_02314 [Plasmopara halstedii]CEG45984.1 hypothetical protein PHALS_02314 [Plasmopara halstedii]|eukprot:XP_024582353.1 hypothetical protein PHALS_02314 [Plasmopara halstedii]
MEIIYKKLSSIEEAMKLGLNAECNFKSARLGKNVYPHCSSSEHTPMDLSYAEKECTELQAAGHRLAVRNPKGTAHVLKQSLHATNGTVERGPRHLGQDLSDARGVARYPLDKDHRASSTSSDVVNIIKAPVEQVELTLNDGNVVYYLQDAERRP